MRMNKRKLHAAMWMNLTILMMKEEANQECLLYESVQSQVSGSQWWRVVEREHGREGAGVLTVFNFLIWVLAVKIR